jgi:hypothetical protein
LKIAKTIGNTSATEMSRIELSVTFSNPDGAKRVDSQEVQTSNAPDLAAEQRIARILFAELNVMAGPHDIPKHIAIAQRWKDFPRQPASFVKYFDIQNSQAVWFELTNLIMGVEGHLALAKAYKALEPFQEPSFDDDVALNELFYIHDRKVSLLNQAVHDLIKVQDLVNRLLHESLGGDLVDATKPDWERTQLTRKNVNSGLASKLSAGMLSQADFKEIDEALTIPKSAPKGDIALAYRNRLAHHIRPSVDYTTFYSAIQSRADAEVKDAQGKRIGFQIAIKASPPVEYRFEDLHAAFSEYLDAIVAMLDKLSKVDILRR